MICEFFGARNGCTKKSSMLTQKDISIHEKVFLNRAFWVQFDFSLSSLSHTITTINVIIITVTITKIIIMPKLYLEVGAAYSCRHIPLSLVMRHVYLFVQRDSLSHTTTTIMMTTIITTTKIIIVIILVISGWRSK